MELAKAAFDVGLFVDGDLEAVLEHWQRNVGVAYDEMLPTGAGVRQHRHRLGDSIIKINHARDPLPLQPPAGYAQLQIAAGVESATAVPDPQGHDVLLVPAGEVTQLRLLVRTADIAAQARFYDEVLQLQRVSERLFACGASQIELIDGPAVEPHVMRAPGLRYITVQVFDVLAEHARILERGGVEGRAPVRLGDVAHISFVHDADGNWIEISQRKSLTGTLDRPSDQESPAGS